MKAIITKFNNSGFTLVEVLVAVGVLSVVSVAFIPSFSNSNREKNLQQNSETVRDALATARNKALTQVGNPGLADANKYKYSAVKFVEDSSTVTYFRSIAADSNTCYNLPSGQVEIDSTKTLSNDVVARIASAETPTCIFFEFGTGNALASKGTIMSGGGTLVNVNASICAN